MALNLYHVFCGTAVDNVGMQNLAACMGLTEGECRR
jgi:hypothetical protein